MAACLSCAEPLRHTLVDLGMSPLCESYLTAEQLNHMEPFYPLHVWVCERCFLVQVEEYVRPEGIFTEYAYFSSYSDSWLAHMKAYADMIIARLDLGERSKVVELGSNDGYLLQYFVAKRVPVLGVEPARNVAQTAIARGVPTVTKLFGRQTARERVTKLRGREVSAGLDRLETYDLFTEQVHETKRRLLEFLIGARRRGKRIAGYGAPGKGNTLLNYCGIRTDFVEYTVDRNPYKHGRFLPGTHIPIHPPEKIAETRPDYVLILPWNLKDEIMEQLSAIRSWGGQFVVPIPDVKVYP